MFNWFSDRLQISQKTSDLFTFIKKILDRKLYFLHSVKHLIDKQHIQISDEDSKWKLREINSELMRKKEQRYWYCTVHAEKMHK